ncbi:MAG: universal stress protein [Candidatus Bathyarchaeia archaeon]
MISKILVALDGSEHATRALSYAIDLADKYSASITLLSVAHHTIYIPATDDSMDFVTPQVIQECMEAEKMQKEKMLLQALEKIKKGKPNLHVTTKLKEGRPADKIIETAKEENVDIIVMGSRGLGGIKQLFLGSVSDRVADEAPCPVLIVK